MTQEEKAAAYDETIEKLRNFYRDYDTVSCLIDVKKELANLIPELRGNEEERIRKKIIESIKNDMTIGTSKDKELALAWLEKQEHTDSIIEKAKTEKQRVIITETDGDANIDWDTRSLEDARRLLECGLRYINTELEKQGEQKPADKVKPKFHEGDWVIGRATENEPRQIAEITEEGYKTTYGGWIGFSFEEDMRLWTIKDAKDGDVLVCESGWTCIFRTLVSDETFSSYCFMDKTKWFCNKGGKGHTLNKEFMKAYNGEIKPATKEQRDTLMKVMTDAGYTFDFEKKELKKIEQKPTEWSLPYGKNETAEKLIALAECLEMDGDCLFNGLSGNDYGKFLRVLAIELTEVKPAEWSEEDEEIRIDAIKYLELFDAQGIHGNVVTPCIDWLKSLKDRVQPKQEWNKVDEKYISSIIKMVEHCSFSSIGGITKAAAIAWLKECVKPKQEWSEKDEKEVAVLEAYIRSKDWSESHIDRALGIVDELVNKVKSLRPQKH